MRLLVRLLKPHFCSFVRRGASVHQKVGLWFWISFTLVFLRWGGSLANNWKAGHLLISSRDLNLCKPLIEDSNLERMPCFVSYKDTYFRALLTMLSVLGPIKVSVLRCRFCVFIQLFLWLFALPQQRTRASERANSWYGREENGALGNLCAWSMSFWTGCWILNYTSTLTTSQILTSIKYSRSQCNSSLYPWSFLTGTDRAFLSAAGAEKNNNTMKCFASWIFSILFQGFFFQ